jgi:uncharacterized protein YkwD
MRARSSAITLAIATAVAAIVAVLPSSVPGTAAPARAAVGDCTPGSDWGTLRQDLTARVTELVNQHRAARGLSQLSVSTSLTNAAIWKSRHMARYVYMAHADPAPPVARSVGDRLLACGYPATSAGWGENIAYGYTTADAVMQGWLNSSGHRANIENPSFRAIGVGAAASSTGRLYWTQEFGTSTGGSTPPPPPTSYACSNGKDDDADGKIDYPADPGCTSSSDNDEYNVSAPPPPAPTTATAAPSSLTVNAGSMRSGGVSSLAADDNTFFQVASSGGSVQWWGSMPAVPNTLSSLRVVHRGLSSSSCTETLAIWNWRTGFWVSLGSRTVGTTEVETSVAPTGTLADYVSGTTGNGQVAVRVRCSGSYYSSFTSSSDLLRVSYTSP